ncbi:hypothetical protein QTP86_024857 [Hemibagrus guttatus]|nr:hypothetical protein QTP86_024857 [Hemibagrus guttatus]
MAPQMAASLAEQWRCSNALRSASGGSEPARSSSSDSAALEWCCPASIWRISALYPTKWTNFFCSPGQIRIFQTLLLCFTESWLNDAIPDNALNLPGFQLFRADRVAESAGKSRGGGTCFYINERWCTDVTALKKMCCPDLEAFFINCKPFYSPREFSSFILVSVYIPPQAHVSSALQHLADQITHTEQQHPDSVIIILGDFY